MKFIEYQVSADEHGTVWKHNGKLHRLDGPAITTTKGNVYWYFEGVLHRTDGPAIEYNYGRKLWYYKGRLHREDGPAVEFEHMKEYFVNGKPLSEKEFQALNKSCDVTIIEANGKKYRMVEIVDD